jgi:hypothetical protein
LDKLARPASKAKLWWLKNKNSSLDAEYYSQFKPSMASAQLQALQYVQNKFGRESLVLGGRRFRVKNRYNDRVYWRFSASKAKLWWLKQKNPSLNAEYYSHYVNY